MDQEHIETNVFEVKLPKPGPRGLIIRIAAIVLGVGVVAVAVGVIINRSAAPTADPLAQVMPVDTMMFLSMTTHPDQQANYAVVAEAWKGSKEAKQIESTILVGLNYAGFDWETDIQPWLGDRVGVGLVDLGGYDKPAAPTSSSYNFPRYRAPFFILAIQTRDRAKSDKFLAGYRQQLDKSSSSKYYTNTLYDESYRGIPIVYQTTESSYSGLSDGTAFAAVNDVIVLTIGGDNLKKVIDAALDGRNLATSNNFKTTMGALPAQNVGALYMDYGQYMNAALKMYDSTASDTGAIFDNIATSVYSNSNATPDPALQKMIDENKKRQEDARQKQQAQMQQLRGLMQTIGGVGMVMTYEPTGLRFDMAEQVDRSQLSDRLQSLSTGSVVAASNHIFDSIPASAVFALNGNTSGTGLAALLDPDVLSLMTASLPGVTGQDVANKLAEFEKAAGVDLKADLLNLLNGETAFFMLPKSNQAAPKPSNPYSYAFNFPFDLGAMFDSSDAARVSSSLDKIVNALIATSKSSGVQLQPLNRAPYSALLDKQSNMLLAYGPVNKRFVIGSTPDTLDAIANAAQAPLSADPTFKEATAILSPDRLSTGYFNLSPLWKWVASLSGGSNCGACNYLSAFKWISLDGQAPANGIEKGSMHIGLQPAKTDLLSQ